MLEINKISVKCLYTCLAVVCSKHFAKTDVIEKTELQKAVGYSPERARRLKEYAIPLR